MIKRLLKLFGVKKYGPVMNNMHCPFCMNTGTEYADHHLIGYRLLCVKEGVAIICLGCGATGPMGKGRDDAKWKFGVRP